MAPPWAWETTQCHRFRLAEVITHTLGPRLEDSSAPFFRSSSCCPFSLRLELQKPDKSIPAARALWQEPHSQVDRTGKRAMDVHPERNNVHCSLLAKSKTLLQIVLNCWVPAVHLDTQSSWQQLLNLNCSQNFTLHRIVPLPRCIQSVRCLPSFYCVLMRSPHKDPSCYMNSKVMKAAFNYFDRDRDGHISLQLPQVGLV